jgi:hypothetical protein
MASPSIEKIKAIAHLIMCAWIPATQWDKKRIDLLFWENCPLMAHALDEKFKQAFFILGTILQRTTIPLEKIKAIIPEVTRQYVESRGFTMEMLHELFGMTLAEYIGKNVGAKLELAESRRLTVEQQYELSFVFITGWIKSLMDEETLKKIRLRILADRLSERPVAETYEIIATWADKTLSYERIEAEFPMFRKVCKEMETSLTKSADELGIKRRDLVLKLFKESYVEIIMEMTRTF